MNLKEIQASPELHQQFLDKGMKRFRRSASFFRPYHEKAVRFNKIYRGIQDAAYDNDEPNSFLPYAYAVIQDLISKSVEPILKAKTPCMVKPKRVGDEDAAENFASIAGAYFHNPRYQVEITESAQECITLGSAWEKDVWMNQWAKARKWSKVRKLRMIDKITSLLGKVIPLDKPVGQEYEAMEEVPYDFPEMVGYNTEFPSFFNVFPEPGVKNVRDMHWIVEQIPSAAVDDLKKATFLDVATNQQVPLYDFSQMYNDRGGVDGAMTPLQVADKDYGKESREAVSGQSEDEGNDGSNQDADHVHLLQVWEKDRWWVIAQGNYVVCYQEMPFQIPRLPYRLKVYTASKDELLGIGAIEPCEDLFYGLNDVTNLAMMNWIRAIHQMVAVHEGAVPYLDDFKPQAMGKIRVRTSVRVQDAIMPLGFNDVTRSMLEHQSNYKGLIERVTAMPDFSPGTDGTKQYHKTLGGLMEISRSIGERQTTVRRMMLSSYQDQMWFMEKLFSQFQFSPIPVTCYSEDGSASIKMMTRDSIDTNGAGFDFLIEYDPSYGDDALARNQLMVLLDLSIKYEQARLTMGGKDVARVSIEGIMRRVFKAFGWVDTSRILVQPDGRMDPDAEFQLMMQGVPMAPKESDDQTDHIITHYLQENSPELKKMMETGKVPPEALMLLRTHREAHMMFVKMVLQNPGQVAQKKLIDATMKQAGAGKAEAMKKSSAPVAASADSGQAVAS